MLVSEPSLSPRTTLVYPWFTLLARYLNPCPSGPVRLGLLSRPHPSQNPLRCD